MQIECCMSAKLIRLSIEFSFKTPLKIHYSQALFYLAQALCKIFQKTDTVICNLPLTG